jgi:hypothetical protein
MKRHGLIGNPASIAPSRGFMQEAGLLWELRRPVVQQRTKPAAAAAGHAPERGGVANLVRTPAAGAPLSCVVHV